MKQTDIYTEALICLRSILQADHPEPHRFSHMDFIALNPGSLDPGKNAFCFSKSALRAGSRLLTGKYQRSR